MNKYEIILYWSKRTRLSSPKFRNSRGVPLTGRLAAGGFGECRGRHFGMVRDCPRSRTTDT